MAQLLRRCAVGPGVDEAWSLLHKSESPRVRSYALHFMAATGLQRMNHVDVEDVCMEIWGRLWRTPSSTLLQLSDRPETAFRAYTKRCTRNHVIDLQRRAHAKGRDMARAIAPEQLADFAAADHEPDPLEELVNQDLLAKVAERLRLHSATSPTGVRDYQIFLLHFVHGLSAAKIAQFPGVNLSRGGVEKVLIRLRALLDGLDDDPPAGEAM